MSIFPVNVIIILLALRFYPKKLLSNHTLRYYIKVGANKRTFDPNTGPQMQPIVI